MTDKMFKLSDKYANLLIEVLETHIKAVIQDNHSTINYSRLLEPGTMVYFNNQLWFHSKPYGVWTKSVYDFLITIFNYGQPVEVVFDPRHFIPKG